MRFFGRQEIRTVRVEHGPFGPETFVNIEGKNLTEDEVKAVLAEHQGEMFGMFRDMEAMIRSMGLPLEPLEEMRKAMVGGRGRPRRR